MLYIGPARIKLSINTSNATNRTGRDCYANVTVTIQVNYIDVIINVVVTLYVESGRTRENRTTSSSIL